MQDDTAPEQPGGRKHARNPKGSPEGLAKGRAKQAASRAARAAEGKRPTPVRKGTKAGISQDIRLAVLTSFNFIGGVKWLAKQAQKNPSAYMALLGKCLVQDDGSAEKNITFVIQQLAPSTQPVAGVLTSPIASHVPPPLKLISNGEVIDPGAGNE